MTSEKCIISLVRMGSGQWDVEIPPLGAFDARHRPNAVQLLHIWKLGPSLTLICSHIDVLLQTHNCGNWKATRCLLFVSWVLGQVDSKVIFRPMQLNVMQDADHGCRTFSQPSCSDDVPLPWQVTSESSDG